MLAGISPIRAWRLPPSHKVDIRVRPLKDCYGTYEPDPHTIVISSEKNGHLDTLIRTMAHEMVHLKLYLKGDTQWNLHEPSFIELADQVTSALGFDPKEF